MTTQSPHPFHLIVKPVGAKCNLDCKYCYYLRKQERYEADASMQMSEALLEHYIRSHIDAQPATAKHIEFSWQGGEPALRGLAFYEKAIELQRQYMREGISYTNNFQTNGTLINDRWAAFFKKHNFLVGISIDGDKRNHGPTRPNLKSESSFNQTLRGLEALKRHEVRFNTLSVVHSDNAHLGKHTYNYLKSLGATVIQFQPCMEDPRDRRTEKDWSLTPEQWGQFLCEVFDEWKTSDVGDVFVQFFENTLGILAGQPSQMCFYGEVCGQQMMLEHDGSVYSCDHFSYNEYRVGQLKALDPLSIPVNEVPSSNDTDLGKIAGSTKQLSFGTNKWLNLPKQCIECDFRPLCNGGCPKDRIATNDSQSGVNALCAGYKQFFLHSLPTYGAILDALKHGHPAATYPLFLS
ncbi:anaerobic sulfatase maturase [Aliagarivorans marinus]|uniref:anaerobic sulfatase maturase n=1 Tax=Aliagarivorans marinus TaxID=561965 RepID=UPI000406724B|nr:anaerobic sulfatase maturase [Aliagarivorans marinus]